MRRQTTEEHSAEYLAYLRGHRDGLIEGVARYAINKNGAQVVGVFEKPLRDVIAKIRKEYEEKGVTDAE